MLQLEVNKDLFLKSFSIENATEVLSCIQRNTSHLQQWIPWIKPKSDLGQIEAFIYEQIKHAEHQEGIMLGIYQNNELIGMIGLQDWDHQLGIAELGFWIEKRRLRQGIMTVAIKRLVQFGFTEMQLNKIIATFSITNVRAHKLLERIGFKLEGVLRNQMLHHGIKTNKVVMGFLKEEWVH